MTDNIKPGAEEVREVLDYCQITGLFFWKKNQTNGVVAGDVAGGFCQNGYLRISLGDKSYYQHRLAWLHVHGEWPSQQIDHINGDKADNRTENLRLATPSQNLQNRRPGKRNNSGCLGVCLETRTQKWMVTIGVYGESKFLGRFKDLAEAIAVRKSAEKEFYPFRFVEQPE